MAAAGLPRDLRAAQDSLEHIPARPDVAYTVPPESFVTNVTVHVSTNLAVAANAVTNVSGIPFNGIAAVMPAGGTVVEGRLLQGKKDWFGARICFRNALRLDHEYQFALANLALTYQSMGRRELAVPAAMVAYGLATDGWCKTRSEGVLKADR